MNKRRGEEYQLFWSESPDFVRLAAKMDALIVPFAAVGGDDAFEVALDPDELLATPILGDLMRSALDRVDPELDIAVLTSSFHMRVCVFMYIHVHVGRYVCMACIKAILNEA